MCAMDLGPRAWGKALARLGATAQNALEVARGELGLNVDRTLF